MKIRSFEEVWLDLERLKGKTVDTLVNHVKSDIIDIDSSGMLRRSEIYNEEKTVERSAFERVWKDLTEKGYCKIGSRWSIACACIALLPEIEYSVSSRTIRLTENKHEFGILVEKV